MPLPAPGLLFCKLFWPDRLVLSPWQLKRKLAKALGPDSSAHRLNQSVYQWKGGFAEVGFGRAFLLKRFLPRGIASLFPSGCRGALLVGQFPLEEFVEGVGHAPGEP